MWTIIVGRLCDLERKCNHMLSLSALVYNICIMYIT